MMAGSVSFRPSCISIDCHRALAGRGLLQQRDDFLADAAFRPLPGRLHRNLPGLALHRRQRVKLGAARFLDLFERIGLEDEHLLSSSDLDVNQRIHAAGGRILVVPDVIINYAADANLRAFRRHVFADGVWVSYVMKFGKRAWSWRHWVPAAFVLSLVVAFALGAVNRGFLWLGLSIAGLYVAASLAVSLQITVRERDPRYAFLLPIVFAVRHFVHGIGALFGLVLVVLPGEHWKGRRGRKA